LRGADDHGAQPARVRAERPRQPPGGPRDEAGGYGEDGGQRGATEQGHVIECPSRSCEPGGFRVDVTPVEESLGRDAPFAPISSGPG
jgi:hypothetical protein